MWVVYAGDLRFGLGFVDLCMIRCFYLCLT